MRLLRCVRLVLRSALLLANFRMTLGRKLELQYVIRYNIFFLKGSDLFGLMDQMNEWNSTKFNEYVILQNIIRHNSFVTQFFRFSAAWRVPSTDLGVSAAGRARR